MLSLILALVAVAILAACGGGSSRPLVAFYGDSITTGTHWAGPTDQTPVTWPVSPVERMAELGGFDALDYSANGARAADVRIRDDAAQLVVLRFGVADTVAGTSPADLVHEITRLVAEAQILGKRVLITGLTHVADGSTAPANAALRRLADGLGVPFADVYGLAFAAADLADPIHPGAAYAARIQEYLAPVIRQNLTKG